MPDTPDRTPPEVPDTAPATNDDGAPGTLERPRERDEGGEGVTDTIPDA